MTVWFEHWWVWMVLGGILGILEVALPGFVLLGFALGAALTGILVGTGILGAALAPKLFVFALASLAAWYGLLRTFGHRKGQVKVWEKDINES